MSEGTFPHVAAYMPAVNAQISLRSHTIYQRTGEPLDQGKERRGIHTVQVLFLWLDIIFIYCN